MKVKVHQSHLCPKIISCNKKKLIKEFLLNPIVDTGLYMFCSSVFYSCFTPLGSDKL